MLTKTGKALASLEKSAFAWGALWGAAKKALTPVKDAFSGMQIRSGMKNIVNGGSDAMLGMNGKLTATGQAMLDRGIQDVMTGAAKTGLAYGGALYAGNQIFGGD